MSRCRKCKGAGEVPDLTWCGDETCCPRMLECLSCRPFETVDLGPLLAATAADIAALAEVAVPARAPAFDLHDLVYHYDPNPAPDPWEGLQEGQVLPLRDPDGNQIGTVTVGSRSPADTDVVELRFAVEPPS